MPVQATQNSPSAWMINGLQAATTIQKDDGKISSAGKYSARVGFAPLALLAAIETVVFTVLTAVTFGQWSKATNGLSIAARSVVEAGKSIVGSQTPEVAKTTPGKIARVKAAAAYYAGKAWNGVKATGSFAADKVVATGKFGYNHKLAIGLGVAGFAALYAGYKYDAVGYVFPAGNITNATAANATISNVTLPSNVSLAANVSLASNVTKPV